MKMITIENPSESVLEYLQSHENVKTVEADGPVQALGQQCGS